jgi:AcrR family transcriptional regulator
MIPRKCIAAIGEGMPKRPYRLQKRAVARDETRERIVQATMSLHDEQGVATTTFADVAERARVGAATIYRNFPTLGDLVQACGAHVWQDMRPPVPADAEPLFQGIASREARLERLIETLDAFYRRGELRLVRAGQDRERVIGLDFFLKQVEAGVDALVREALGKEASEPEIRLALALTDLKVWLSLKQFLPQADLRKLMLGLLACALSSVNIRI